MVITSMLQKAAPGCTIDTAENGEVAVELASNKDYDLILMVFFFIECFLGQIYDSFTKHLLLILILIFVTIILTYHYNKNEN